MAAAVIVALCLLYILCLRGRTGMAGMEELARWRYAHRGAHDAEKPENSMAAFRAALEMGCGVELDVHLLRDGTLAVLHDSDLRRMTGCPGTVEELTGQQLCLYHLSGSGETIPKLQQVLALFAGRAPLIIELKTSGGNHARLCQAVCEALDGYQGLYCLESFDPRCVIWLRKNRPDLIRGQLTQNWLKRDRKLPFVLRLLMNMQVLNLLSRPDFLACRYPDRRRPGIFLCRKLWRIPGVSWTLDTRQDYDQAIREGWIPIFEGFRPD